MHSLSLFSDTELLARVAAVVQAERIASADVVEHLMEVERRRLYLDQACSSLYTYCRERLARSARAKRVAAPEGRTEGPPREPLRNTRRGGGRCGRRRTRPAKMPR